MGTICLQCGDKGYDNAFVFCVKCLEYAVHRYCLDVIPEDFDEFVRWVCDDCGAELRTRNETDGVVSIETEDDVCEDFSQHLYNACTKFDLVECPRAANGSSLEEFIVLNDEENEKSEQNTTQQLEHGENEYTKTQQKTLSDFVYLKANVKKKRSKKKKSTMKKDSSNPSKRLRVECQNIDACKTVKLPSDGLTSCEVKEKKIFEPGMMEIRMLSRNSSPKSSINKKEKENEKKAFVPSEANLKEQNQENDGVELENHHTGSRAEGGAICTSNGHQEKGVLGVGKEFPKDTNMLDCSMCAEPIFTPVWSGSFNFSGKRHGTLNGLKGHVSSKACHKVYKEISFFQPDLHLKLLPHDDVWPKSFKLSDPSEENIALFFFPSEISEPAYNQLIEEMRVKYLALKGVVQNAEILIFTSLVLPLMYWRFNNKCYLWGVFRAN